MKKTLFLFSLLTFYLLEFNVNKIFASGFSYNFQGSSYVVDFQTMWKKVKESHDKPLMFFIYYSQFCPYCSNVKRHLKYQSGIDVAEINENDNYPKQSKSSNHIVVLIKNIYGFDRFQKSRFHHELKHKANKVQVPALEYKNFIMFESSDIINFFKEIVKQNEKAMKLKKMVKQKKSHDVLSSLHNSGFQEMLKKDKSSRNNLKIEKTEEEKTIDQCKNGKNAHNRKKNTKKKDCPK